MSINKRVFIVFIVAVIGILCDQGTKFLAVKYLQHHPMSSYLNDLLRIGYTENVGAFLGLGNSLPEQTRFYIFVVAVGGMLVGLLFYLLLNAKQTVFSLMAFSLVFVGGISNFYDRVMNNGAVVDFLNVGIGTLRTGVFNIADVLIMAGVFLLLFLQLKGKN